MFENKTFKGIYYSRFIASWIKAGGRMNYVFEEWLKGLLIEGERIPNEVVSEIVNLGMNGKLELEVLAKFELENLAKLKKEGELS